MKFAPAAVRDLQRLRNFLCPKSAAAAQRVGGTIRQSVKILGAHPKIGRLIEGLPETYREWQIDFGGSGYMARYRLDGDVAAILAIRHQKEADYK